MTTLTEQQAEQQLRYLQESGFQSKMSAAAQSNGISPVFVYAIASRETNCCNILGDWQQGEAHGVGIMQIDIQQPLAKTMRDNGTWKTSPGLLINFGVSMLADNLAHARRLFPALSGTDQLRLAADGYNEGQGTADHLEAIGKDPDWGTTGRDYGNDVIARMALFSGIIAKTVTEG